MTSFLGPHLNLVRDVDGFFARARPRIAKALVRDIAPERLRELARLSPDTVWVGRIVLDAQPLDDPARSGRELGEQTIEWARRYPDVDYWSGYNEIDCPTPQAMAAYCEHEIQRASALHRAGLKAAVGGFSTGCPEVALWSFFYPALAFGDALHLHEYDAPNMRRLSTWLCGRFVRVYEMLPPEYRKPLIISECGVDDGQRGGWKRYLSAAQYMEELAWYDGLLAQKAMRWPILGACVFCWGGAFGWDSFDIDGEVAERLEAHIVASRRPKRLTIWQRVLALIDRLRGR